MKKECKESDLSKGSPDTNWRPWRHSHKRFTFSMVIFDKLIQLLLHSKVAKAELYLIGGNHNKWLDRANLLYRILSSIWNTSRSGGTYDI